MSVFRRHLWENAPRKKLPKNAKYLDRSLPTPPGPFSRAGLGGSADRPRNRPINRPNSSRNSVQKIRLQRSLLAPFQKSQFIGKICSRAKMPVRFLGPGREILRFPRIPRKSLYKPGKSAKIRNSAWCRALSRRAPSARRVLPNAFCSERQAPSRGNAAARVLLLANSVLESPESLSARVLLLANSVLELPSLSRVSRHGFCY